MAMSPRPANLTVVTATTGAPCPETIGLTDFLVDDRPTYTIDEAASLLGVSKSTAYECAHTGELPVLRLGRRLLVTRVTLLQLLGLDALLPNLTANGRQRLRRTRWRRLPEPAGTDEPVPDRARPHGQRPTE
jgi:excisionase family DNA binding protein